MRSTVSAVLIAGVAAQWSNAAPAGAAPAQWTAPAAASTNLGAPSTSLGASLTANPSFAANPSLGSSLGASLGASFGASSSTAVRATTLGAPTQAPVAPSGATTRGLPIGTVNGIQDSDVVCAQNGYQGAACGLPNVASIYNPNVNMRYQTQYSDNALALLQSTNRYNAAGQRIINPATGNAALDLGTIDIPTQNAAASGVATTFTNDPSRSAIQQTTNWLNNGALANYVAPSASNAVLPNSVAFQQANLAPWSTTPVNTLTGAGFGYSTLQGLTAGTVKAPVPSTPVAPTTFGLGATTFGAPLQTAGTFSTLPANAWAAQPFATSSYLPATPSYLPPTTLGTSFQTFPQTSFQTFPQTTSFGTSFQTFPQTAFPQPTFQGSFGLGSTYQLPNYQPAVNPAAQPFTNAYSNPGMVGPPSQLGVQSRPF